MTRFTKKGVAFQIDDEDAFAVGRYSWRIGSRGYPMTNVGKQPNQRLINLHVFLLGRAPAGLEWDHINRDRLDNRRANLRAVTRAVNARNTGLYVSNTSGVNGVSWHKACGKWQAQLVRVEGGVRRTIYLGIFASKADAIAARLAAEKELWR